METQKLGMLALWKPAHCLAGAPELARVCEWCVHSAVGHTWQTQMELSDPNSLQLSVTGHVEHLC